MKIYLVSMLLLIGCHSSATMGEFCHEMGNAVCDKREECPETAILPKEECKTIFVNNCCRKRGDCKLDSKVPLKNLQICTNDIRKLSCSGLNDLMNGRFPISCSEMIQ